MILYSSRIQMTIICDICKAQQTYSGDTLRHIELTLRGDGWNTDDALCNKCPKCNKENK